MMISVRPSESLDVQHGDKSAGIPEVGAALRVRDFAAGTEAGGRPYNEDAVLEIPSVPVFAVADGMGGGGSGDVASALALDYVRRHASTLREQNEVVAKQRSTTNRLELGRQLDGLFNRANQEIYQRSVQHSRTEMGSTLLIASVIRNHCYIAHVGDSRAYLIRNGELLRLTEDHSVAELHYRRGRITQEEYEASPQRRVLYQVLGAGVEVEVDLVEVRLMSGDMLLLCTDGLVRALTDAQIGAVIDADDLSGSVQGLLQRAASKAVDNVSAVLIGFESDEPDEGIDVLTRTLRDVFLFRDMSEQELLVVAPYVEEVVAAGGDVLLTEGDPTDAFFMVVSGRLRITRGNVRLMDVTAGGHFGEVGLARSMARSHSVRAMTKTRMLMFSRARFLQLCKAKPEIGARLALALLDSVGERMRLLSDRLEAVERAIQGIR